MSKFADNLEDLAQRTAEYIRVLEEGNRMLREEKNYLLHKAGENIAEIAQLQVENNNLRETLTDYEECSKSLTLEKHELLKALEIAEITEIAELREQVKNALIFAEFTLDRAQNFCDEYLENEAREFIKAIKRS